MTTSDITSISSEHKYCDGCGETKRLVEFSRTKGKNGIYYHLHQCKRCRSIRYGYQPRSDRVVCSGEKQCSKCGQLKLYSEYYKDKRNKDGFYASCKACFYKRTPRMVYGDAPAGYKHCSRHDKCLHPDGPVLPATPEYFNKDKWEPDELTIKCKCCGRESGRQSRRRNIKQRTAYGRRYYATHIEQNRQRNKRYGTEHRDIKRLASSRWEAKRRELPADFSKDDYAIALEYFHGACAYCGNPPSFFDHHPVLHAEHFVPLSSPNCPGTVKTNMLPACQGCNLNKRDKDPHRWLIERFGKRRASQIEARIAIYFEWTKFHEK